MNHLNARAACVMLLGLTACGGGGGGAGGAGPNSASIVLVQGYTDDAVYDPRRAVLYLSVSSAAGTGGNVIAAVDPSSGQVRATQFAGSEPGALAISDDGQFLYAALDGEARIQRFTLPGLKPDISIPLGTDSHMGPYYAMGIQVAPGKPHTIAVTLGSPVESALLGGFSIFGGLVIFDDAVIRPQMVHFGADPSGNMVINGLGSGFAWAKDGTTIYASDFNGGNFYVASVSASGVQLTQDRADALGSQSYIHFDRDNGLIYTEGGKIVTPSTGAVTQAFNAFGPMISDAAGNTAYFVTLSTSDYQLSQFDLTTYAVKGNVPLTIYPDRPKRLINVGNRRVALLTEGGVVQLVAVGGSGSRTVNTLAGSIPSGSFTESLIQTPGSDLAWDSGHGLFYVAVQSPDSVSPSRIVAVDPSTGQTVASQTTAAVPHVLAVSDNNQYLYVSEWPYGSPGTIERFVLPTLTPDISYSLGSDSFLGPLEGRDIQVAPGAPHTLALTTLGSDFGEVLVYDDATVRPQAASSTNDVGASFNSLQWGPDASTLYAFDFIDSGFAFYQLSVDSNGPALTQTYPYAENPYAHNYNDRIHFDRGTGLVFGENGMVVDPVTKHPRGLILAGDDPMVPDAVLNKAFFLSPNAVESYDLSRYTPLQHISIKPISSTQRPLRLLRWGSDGLAFIAADGIHLIQGAFVNAPVSASKSAMPELPAAKPRARQHWARPELPATRENQASTEAMRGDWLGVAQSW